MAVASASTTLLLTDPMLLLPENTWDTAVPDAIPTVGATGIVSATGMTTPGIGIGIVIVIVLRVATTETVVTGTWIGTGVIEGAPVATLPNAGREEVILAARLGEAPDVLANVSATVINLVVFCQTPRLWDASHCRFQVIKFRDPFIVLYQDFKLKLFRQLA